VDWLIEPPLSLTKEEEKKRLSVVNDTAKNLVADLRETIWAMKKEFIQLDELADKLKSFLQSQCLLRPQMEMQVNEKIENNILLSPTEALNIFRVCQEAIVNSVKHADAQKTSLNITSSANSHFEFIIEDNGNGFNNNAQFDDHYGLENMKHRAVEIGAKLIIHSEIGKGTKVSLIKS
jgi:signal transduction histidine kinase